MIEGGINVRERERERFARSKRCDFFSSFDVFGKRERERRRREGEKIWAARPVGETGILHGNRGKDIGHKRVCAARTFFRDFQALF